MAIVVNGTQISNNPNSISFNGTTLCEVCVRKDGTTTKVWPDGYLCLYTFKPSTASQDISPIYASYRKNCNAEAHISYPYCRVVGETVSYSLDGKTYHTSTELKPNTKLQIGAGFWQQCGHSWGFALKGLDNVPQNLCFSIWSFDTPISWFQVACNGEKGAILCLERGRWKEDEDTDYWCSCPDQCGCIFMPLDMFESVEHCTKCVSGIYTGSATNPWGPSNLTDECVCYNGLSNTFAYGYGVSSIIMPHLRVYPILSCLVGCETDNFACDYYVDDCDDCGCPCSWHNRGVKLTQADIDKWSCGITDTDTLSVNVMYGICSCTNWRGYWNPDNILWCVHTEYAESCVYTLPEACGLFGDNGESNCIPLYRCC